MNWSVRWSLLVTVRLLLSSKLVTGRADVQENYLARTDVEEENSIIVVGGKSEFEKLSEVSKLVTKQIQVVRTGRNMLNINLENSRGERISTISCSPTSLLMSLITLILYVFFGEGDLTSKGLMIAQVLNG
jgi:hypothetical protein